MVFKSLLAFFPVEIVKHIIAYIPKQPKKIKYYKVNTKDKRKDKYINKHFIHI